ncbi:MAG: hypothetical protein K2N14_02440, partial [Clostridia bacterium]|nr:hypothetical protein [Clostridia bacterium]
VSDNYYGFALNAAKVTGGILNKLNAGITRNDNGLDRVIAKGSLKKGVDITFGANLQFKKDWNEDYVVGTANEGGKSAPSLYDAAMGEAEKAGQTPDFDHFVSRPNGKDADEVFGCFYVTGANGGYTFKTEYLYPLYTHTLTVVGIDGEIEERLVKHGSTVYLYDNDHPVFNQNKTERILYSLSQDSVGASKIEVTDDVTVYAVARKAATVIVHSGTEEYTVSTFAGDTVPTTVTGLESLKTPAYEDGTPVGQNDKVTENDTVKHIYGEFVKTEIVVNYVTYTFKDGAY